MLRISMHIKSLDMKHYTGNITPEPGTIFVFGSNTEGRHGAGSALVAVKQFGAVYGVPRGLQGNAYGLITTELGSHDLYPLEWIEENIKELYQVARNLPEKKFMVAYRSQPDEKTLCGYTGRQLFNCFLRAGDIPDNIYFSEEWYNMVK